MALTYLQHTLGVARGTSVQCHLQDHMQDSYVVKGKWS